MLATPYVRHPRSVSKRYRPEIVADAYNYPTDVTGVGYTCGIIELGGGYSESDLEQYFSGRDVDISSVSVDGGKNQSDGPNGADGEVLLDIEIVAAVAPGAEIKVYFAPNTDDGFLHAIEMAIAECDVVSISWGGPETSWSVESMKEFDTTFVSARAKGVLVFCASGDTGSNDGTSTLTVDFPASSPNVIACGGTRLEMDNEFERISEVAWNDNPTTSATGGGVSKVFAGRQVPDVAGNADPETGYLVHVDGSDYVVGGTSAVAPLYSGMALLLSQKLGHRLGSVIDLLNTLETNPGVCFDVTVGNNGGYKAGPGRDNVSGLGVVDAGKLYEVIISGNQVPEPIPDPTNPDPAPTKPVNPPTSGGDDGSNDLPFPGCDLAVASHIDKTLIREKISATEWLNHHFRTYFRLNAEGNQDV